MTAPPGRDASPAVALAHRAQYVALRVVVALLSVASWRAAGGIGSVIGRLGYWPLRIRRRTVDTQLLSAFPDVGQAERRRIAIGAYAHLGRVALETAVAPRHIERTPQAVFHPAIGWEHLERPTSEGRGVILISGHFGNWELGAAYVASRGLAISAVVRRMGNPFFDGYLNRSRRRLGWNIIYDADAVRKLPRVIAEGHVVPLLADQGVKGLSSTFVPFFGRLARTPRGPAVFALRLNAPCVLAAVPREPDGKYRLCIEPVPVVDTGDRERDVETIVAAYTRQLEAWVRRYPDQYLWQHRRWRRRPGGAVED